MNTITLIGKGGSEMRVPYTSTKEDEKISVRTNNTSATFLT